MNEYWADISGYEGKYMISSIGRVRSNVTDIMLSLVVNSCGYTQVTLCDTRGHITKHIHRLVAIEFIGKPDGYEIVNHRDGDKSNNNATNLEWCTPKMNRAHACETGLIKRKLSEFDTYMMKILYGTFNSVELSTIYGVSLSHTWRIINNIYTHGSNEYDDKV